MSREKARYVAPVEDCPYGIGSDRWEGAAKVIEEAGELIQVLAKLMATGGSTDYYDGSDLRERLVEELADLQAALTCFIDWNHLDLGAIAIRRNVKAAGFRQWANGERRG